MDAIVLARTFALAYIFAMPGTPHEVLITALRDRPALLAELVKRVAGQSLSKPVAVADSTVRITKAIEVRPDLILRTRRREWTIVEVQNQMDARKRRSWLLAVSLLLRQEKMMGEVIIITSSRRVASWAERAAHLRGKSGTRLELTPIVLLLAGKTLEALLDPAHPELALFAAWAMQDRRDAEAHRVASRAIALAALLPKPLRKAEVRAILSVLSEPVLALVEEMAMDVNKIPETRASRRVALLLEKREDEAEARGKRAALLAVLAARGLPITGKDKARIEASTSPDELDRWIKKAATAMSVHDVLGPEPTRRTAPKAPKAHARKARPSARRPSGE